MNELNTMEPIETRIPNYTYKVILNDCEKFNFVTLKNKPNKNDFLNRLIPNFRKFHIDVLDDTKEIVKQYPQINQVQNISEILSQIINKAYFSNDYLDLRPTKLRIRPQKKNNELFSEIIDEYSKLSKRRDLSDYLRGILVEYSMLAPFKREQIIFYDEIGKLTNAWDDSKLVSLNYNGQKYDLRIFFPVNVVESTQKNYVVGIINNDEIKAFELSKITDILIRHKSFYEISDKLNEKLLEYVTLEKFIK